MTHLSMKMSREQHFCCLMVYGIFYEIHVYHFSCLVFTTFITYCAALRSFDDGKSVIFFSFKFEKKIEIYKRYMKRFIIFCNTLYIIIMNHSQTLLFSLQNYFPCNLPMQPRSTWMFSQYSFSN